MTESERPSYRLTEVRDEQGVLTHKMCTYCFELIPVKELWKDHGGQTRDSCIPCAIEQRLT